jgi:hypothetical protein
MADIEYSGTESEPTFNSSLPLLVWKIEGETAGKYWLTMFEGKIQAVWVPAGEAVTSNARRALGVQQVEIDQAMFDFLTDDENGFHIPVLVPKP